MEIEKERLTMAKHDQQLNQNYREEQTIIVVEIKKKPYYSVLCERHGDIMVCQENCSISYQPNFNFEHFNSCECYDENYKCRICKCGMNQQLHGYEIPVSKHKTVEQIIQSKKAAYDAANRTLRTTNAKLNQLELARNALENDVNQLKKELINTIDELKEICTHFNFLEEMKSTIEKLRKEAKIATNMRAKELTHS